MNPNPIEPISIYIYKVRTPTGTLNPGPLSPIYITPLTPLRDMIKQVTQYCLKFPATLTRFAYCIVRLYWRDLNCIVYCAQIISEWEALEVQRQRDRIFCGIGVYFENQAERAGQVLE